MKIVFGLLFKNDARLQTALCLRELRLLNCRRNIIVHRRGVVDSRYIRDSGDHSVLAGSRLPVNSDVVHAAMAAVRDVALALLQASASLLDHN